MRLYSLTEIINNNKVISFYDDYDRLMNVAKHDSRCLKGIYEMYIDVIDVPKNIVGATIEETIENADGIFDYSIGTINLPLGEILWNIM